MSLVVYLVVIVVSLVCIGEAVRFFASRAEERRWQLTRNALSVVPVSSTARSVTPGD